MADTILVFSQVAVIRLTYFALETPSPEAQAILVLNICRSNLWLT
ncbi:MAG: hypothetical protein ACSLEN_04615 [Candidatus Malihini olakiniferum]